MRQAKHALRGSAARLRERIEQPEVAVDARGRAVVVADERAEHGLRPLLVDGSYRRVDLSRAGERGRGFHLSFRCGSDLGLAGRSAVPIPASR